MHLSRPLHHSEIEDSDPSDDETRKQEARSHLSRSPSLQFVAELLGKLRSMNLPWWTPDQTRALWPATQRMRWLKQRPDIRQAITTQLAGLPPNAARRFWPDEQAVLIDAVLDNGDVDVPRFEAAFDPADLAIYGDARGFWRAFRERTPWEQDAVENKRIMAWLIRALIADRAFIDGVTRRAILAPWEVRSAIDSVTWCRSLPAEIHIELDRARLKHEKSRPREPFQAKHEIGVVTPERIAEYIPLQELALILTRAEDAMSFGEETEPVTAASAPPASEAQRPSQIN